MYKKISIFLIVMLVASFVTSITYILFNYKKDREQEVIFEELEQVIIVEENNKEQEKDESINLQELYNINNDFIGWLEIENTNINYPVMQTGEDKKDYYLYKNFYKEYSQMGTPYIAEFCNVQKSDNLIIYGHHINSNKMFGELEKYKNNKASNGWDKYFEIIRTFSN